MPVPPGLELDLATAQGPVRLEGVVSSVVDGLLVRAAVATDMTLSCARCLADLRQPVAVDVIELFNDPSTADDPDDIEAGYEITEGVIDIDTLVRDALVPAVPYRPLCQADCQGLCAQCGTNLNDNACDCVDETTDARWAALEGLRLRDSHSQN